MELQPVGPGSRDNQSVPAPAVLSPAELASITDPVRLLERAWALEPALRLTERWATLDRLEGLLAAADRPIRALPGRDWQLELMAERALDHASQVRLESAIALADQVLAQADPSCQIAIVRALWARGRALAWKGTEEMTLQADRLFVEVADRCRAMGNDDWLGFILFWRGHTTFYRHGNPERGGELMLEALDVLGADSPRRATVLSFYAEVLGDLGDWDAADRILAEARELTDRDGDPKSRAYVAWTRARIASVRGDALMTERLVREVEREPGDWLETDGGIAFLADAAEMLDRVGLTEQAQVYLHRAQTHPARDEDCTADQASATLLARRGDPVSALEELQKLTRGDWIEKRLMWRHRLLIAWATFRSAREGAGELAALALEEAARSGGVQLALAGEPELTRALLPLAERTGSAHARAALLDGRVLLVRLFGSTRVVGADGIPIDLPAGQPGELVRMLALHEHGLPVDVVLETFFPGAPVSRSRHRLRQILVRLRTVAGEIVIRDGDSLRLLPAWVDVREFIVASNRVRALSGPRTVQFAYAALALWSGPLLPAATYASWAEEIRAEVDYRLAELLELIIADATERRSHQEALTALVAARKHDPDDESRLPAIIEHLTALGRQSTAQHLSRQLDADAWPAPKPDQLPAP